MLGALNTHCVGLSKITTCDFMSLRLQWKLRSSLWPRDVFRSSEGCVSSFKPTQRPTVSLVIMSFLSKADVGLSTR